MHTKLADADLQRILAAEHHDPFQILGRHAEGDGYALRVFRPGMAWLAVLGTDGNQHPLTRYGESDLFLWHGPGELLPIHPRLVAGDGHGNQLEWVDPYSYMPQLGEFDLYIFGQGKHLHAYRFLGAHPHQVEGVEGVLFSTWAPNASRVSVVGDFNRWDGRAHPMRLRSGGVWELFVPGLGEGSLYRFELRNRDTGQLLLKSDPYGRRFEMRPANANLVTGPTHHEWQDAEWMHTRAERDWLHSPMCIYEVHLGSWQRDEQGRFLSYQEIAHRLVGHVHNHGFTHIELLPINEHPLDASWGYQVTGYYAPTSRFGSPDDLRYLIDYCHQSGIGVLLDWVPAHFPKDAFALARFDGTALYEHEDPRKGEHRDWGTLIFNYGRLEVKNFLLSNAIYWLEEFHIDGLRVDAVASMLYLDYSRSAGDWVPNEHGGRENLEAIEFLQELNQVVHELHPGALTIAEESTSWPMVSRPVSMGGLGFSMKWNMGWMNDTLEYMHKDPFYRRYHHNLLTFALIYAFHENFVLPFSHDEVVHLKRSMLDKMPGDNWQRFANLRLLYTFMYGMPGKKLLFMGNEFAHGREWNCDTQLDWHLYDYPQHHGVAKLIADLNHLYREQPALHHFDFEGQGFNWLDCDDADQSILIFQRRTPDAVATLVFNFTPVPRDEFRIGVPGPGHYHVRLNSDSTYYGGSNYGSGDVAKAEALPHQGEDWSISIDLPPLAGMVILRD